MLTLAYLAFYLTDYLLLSGLFLNATVHLVLFVMLLRLYSAKRDRDYYFLAVLAFLMVLAAAVLTVDSLFLAAFAVFMLTAVSTFIFMEMRHAAGKAAIQSGARLTERAQAHGDFAGWRGAADCVDDPGWRGRDFLCPAAGFGRLFQCICQQE